MSLRRLGAAVSTAALVAAFFASDAEASPEQAVATAQDDLSNVSQNLASVQSAVALARTERKSPEQRLADGELLYRIGDFDRAAVVLSEILEEFPGTPSYPDALWLLGETYYSKHDYLAARRDYRLLVDHAGEPRYETYFGRALGRLVDVSLRLDDPPETLTPIFEKFNLVPPAQVDAALLYAKGKAYFRRGAWNEAGQSFAEVPGSTPYTHQARYFEGLVAMKAARAAASGSAGPSGPADYRPAIEAFRAVTELPADTAEHQHVIDLAWLAVGRLLYEGERYEPAAVAYAKVGRDSPEHDTALYELAWVYVRLGDVQRAEQTLELLSVTDPNSQYMGDGSLLRADLLLRAGAFDRALQIYEAVRAKYDPMRAKVDAFLDSTKDTSAYYEKLAQQQELDALDQNEQLPPVAVRWAREAQDGELAFAVVEDVNESKKVLDRTHRLLDRLETLTQTSTRVRAFPDLEAGERTALGLLNRLSRGRLALVRELDEEEPEQLGGAIGEVRDRRRAFMASITDLPVGPEDFGRRDEEGLARWNALSQELTERSSEIDSLRASINGLHRVLDDGPQQGVARDPASLQRFQAELDANERDLDRYQQRVADLRRQIDLGRAEIGLGDARYQNDAVARDQFRDLVDREMQLAAAGAAGSDAASFARTSLPILAQTRAYEDRLVAVIDEFEQQVAERAGGLRQKLEAERANVARYRQQLAAIDAEARDLVGRVAERNFKQVRDRLQGIVVRSDVGVTEEAWEVREEELDRVRTLQTERARQEQVLDEELKEVRDDGVEPALPSP